MWVSSHDLCLYFSHHWNGGERERCLDLPCRFSQHTRAPKGASARTLQRPDAVYRTEIRCALTPHRPDRGELPEKRRRDGVIAPLVELKARVFRQAVWIFYHGTRTLDTSGGGWHLLRAPHVALAGVFRPECQPYHFLAQETNHSRFTGSWPVSRTGLRDE